MLRRLCVVYEVPFQGLLEAIEQSVSRFEEARTFICNPSYSLPRNATLSSSKPCFQSTQDINQIVRVLQAVMEVGGHGSHFCSAMEFKAWDNLFVGEGEQVVKE